LRNRVYFYWSASEYAPLLILSNKAYRNDNVFGSHTENTINMGDRNKFLVVPVWIGQPHTNSGCEFYADRLSVTKLSNTQIKLTISGYGFDGYDNSGMTLNVYAYY
jgi:hypothetical protein